MKLPRVALIGVSGYSRVHLEHLFELHERRELILAAAVVINAAEERDVCERMLSLGCKIFPNLETLLGNAATVSLDLCIVPTPIHLHVRQTLALLHAGINVLVEKPLAASVTEAQRVVTASRETGRLVAVGFQYLHAPEVNSLKAQLCAGAIGRIRRISTYTAWPRSHQYYSRNAWAGKLLVPDGCVLDSPVTNAMAHFFMLLIYFAGGSDSAAAGVTELSAELYRAQEIESFDTAVLTLRTRSGCVLDFYGTHSSQDIVRPVLQIEGDAGTAEWVQDTRGILKNAAGQTEFVAPPEAIVRETMLRDVLARLRGENRFVCPPELALEHVRCVAALHEQVRINEIPGSLRRVRQEDDDSFTYIDGLDDLLASAFSKRVSLRAAGADWAAEQKRVVIG
jgi:predicted dehydrogenase